MQISKRKLGINWRLGFLSILALIVILAGCNSGDDGGSINLFGSEPQQLDSSDAESVATTFLDSWRDRDYPTMYSLITPNARDTFTQQEFEDIYEEVVTDILLNNLTWEITGGPLVQGNTATFNYRVDFDTNLLGKFSDPNPNDPAAPARTMWLRSTTEGWRIAWSRADIFAEWSNTSTLGIQRNLPSRGNIYDRNGKILVDQNGVAVAIEVAQENMPSVDQCITELARILRREVDDMRAFFNSQNPETIFYAGEISEETAQAEDAVLRGFCNYTPVRISTRYYHDRVAPHLIGYIGRIPADQQADYSVQNYPADALVGISGIEVAFESELRGTIGVELFIQSSSGIRIRTIAERDPKPGNSLYLTIDRDLQLGIQSLLADAYSNGQLTWAPTSRGASVAVMDIHTGEILAMASFPDFDPGVFSPNTSVYDPPLLIQQYRDDPRNPLLNRASQGAYPLGSVFKVFSMVAGLDSGVWAAENSVTCTGQWNGTPYNDIVRDDWYTPGHGSLDMQGGLENSCNPYFWQLSVALNSADPNLLPTYSNRFGFGEAMPFQGLAATSGFIQSPEWVNAQEGSPWGQANASNLVIGQGEMRTSPLQVVRATAAVANGGILYDPMVVQRVGFLGEPPTIEYQPQGTDMGLNSEVLALTREAMCNVTLKPTGTAYFIYQPWYEHNGYPVLVCGKTGTAQSGQARPHAWFAAFAPHDTPQYAIVAMVENSCEGSEVAAPIVRRTIELMYPGFDLNWGWPTLWQTGCTEIGPESTG